MIIRLIVASLSLCVNSACAAQVPEGRCIPYWPRQVELRGTLMPTVRYGPPNYGENPNTDAKLIVPVLRLWEPISTCKDSIADSLRGVREVQVKFSPANQAAAFYRQSVRVKGTIGPAALGSDFTPIVLTADSILAEHPARRGTM